MNEELSDQIDDFLAGADSNDIASIVSAIEARMEMGKHYTQEALSDDPDLDLRKDLQDYEQLEDLFAKAISILRTKAKRDKIGARFDDVVAKVQEALKIAEQVDASIDITIQELALLENRIDDLFVFARGYRDQFYKEFQYKNDRRTI